MRAIWKVGGGVGGCQGQERAVDHSLLVVSSSAQGEGLED